jgi:DNA-binding NarL/FixJ family response regulator
MIRVLIADDQPLIRQALRSLLAHESGIEVVGEVGDGQSAVVLARASRPDLVIMDIRMPVLDGIGACRAITADPALSATRVLVLTTFEDEENVVRSIRAGASGFVGKGAEPDALVEAIRVVHAGEALLSPRATRALIDRFVTPDSPPEDHPDLASLTEREREVLVLVARGLSNVEIGIQLSISAATVKTHVNRMMPKLHVHDRAQLVIVAYERGLLRAGGSRPRDTAVLQP